MPVSFFKWRLSPSCVFSVFGLLFGTLGLLILPPLQVPDEQTHFWRSYQVSNGEFISERRGNKAGGVLPRSLLVMQGRSGFNELHFNPDVKTSLDQILDAGRVPLDRNDVVFLEFPNVVPYSPTPYLPQALGIAAGKLFDAPPLVLMYLGRFFNLCASVTLIALAIRWMPVFKWGLFLVALMPISLAEMASLSADSFTNSLSWLLIAFILKMALTSQQILLREKIILGLLFSALALVKLPYLPLIGLFTLIPIRKLVSLKRYVFFFGGLCAISLSLAAGWAIAINRVLVPEVWHGGNPDEQVRFVLSNFPYVLRLISSYLLDHRFFLGQLGVLGWLDTPLPAFLMASWLWVLCVLALTHVQPRIRLTLTDKTKILTVVMAVYYTSLGLLYICCTPPRGTHFLVQGRYFLPVLPLLLLLLYNRNFRLSRWIPQNLLGRVFTAIVLLFPPLSTGVTFFTLIRRYYE